MWDDASQQNVSSTNRLTIPEMTIIVRDGTES